MTRPGAWACVAAAMAAACSSPRPPRGGPSLTVHGTELVLTTGDGRVLRSAQLVGATLAIGALTVRLDAVDRDPRARDEVLRHRFVVLDGDREPTELCEPDPDGDRWAMPLLDDRGQMQLVCSSGAIGKCVRWGYRPWQAQPGEPAMRPLHEACIRMVRADYGGNGATATRDGTRIAFCDRSGVHRCPERARLEAAWSPSGATCVATPRIAELATLDQLAERYPRLIGHLGREACTMVTAADDRRTLLFSLFP
jgi:hypothetical protein